MTSIIAATLLFIAQAHGFEVDNVTCGFRRLKDSAPELDRETNGRLQKALSVYNNNLGNLSGSKGNIRFGKVKKTGSESNSSSANSKSGDSLKVGSPNPPCGREVLQVIRSAVASAWFDNLETWASENSKLDKCLPAAEESVYRYMKSSDSGVMGFAGLNVVINVGGVYIGADKLSHFMTEGFEYHQTYMNLKSKGQVSDRLQGLRNIVQQGTKEEEGGYGWGATGVKSYGDMVADYAGFTFFENLIDSQDPYLKCVDGKWIKAKEFHWVDFVNRGMDESINCNSYVSPEVELKINRAIAETTEKFQYSKAQKCPLDPGKCRDAIEAVKPPEMVAQLISPICRGLPPEYQKSGESKDGSTATGLMLNALKSLVPGMDSSPAEKPSSDKKEISR